MGFGKNFLYTVLGGTLMAGGLAAALYFTDHTIADADRIMPTTDLSGDVIDVDGIPEGRYSPDLSQLTIGAVNPSLGGVCNGDDPLAMIVYGAEDPTQYVVSRVGDTNELELHKVSLTMSAGPE
tara:strand:- start:1621 stop:1992 length:372 start_codon:yes stop_codon:yes gene_type:complete